MPFASSRSPDSSPRKTAPVLGIAIDVLSWDEALVRLLAWANGRQSRFVAICNAHVVVTANQDKSYCAMIESADMATPDGAPVAWMLRRQGYRSQRRINGPDLMWALLEQCERQGLPAYFFGSTPETLLQLESRLLVAYPSLQMAGLESPPFRPLTTEEDAAIVDRINTSGAAFVFVGLGCPKQERWMAEHRGRVQAVMVGVGAAFDFHAGTVARAPGWMRDTGLEWLHRLISEPRRLWRRYLVTNTLFMIGAARQLLFRGIQSV